MEKNTKFEDKLLIGIWIVMGIFLIYYILFGCRVVLNSDSAFVADYSLEQIRTSSIFPKEWYETNDFWIYSLIPIITPLIKFGISVFTSRQIAVLIQSIVLFILLFKVFYDKKQKSNFLIPGLIILSGISGQMLFEVFGDATYGTIIVYMLLILHFVIEYLKNNKKKYLIIIFLSNLLLTICSLRFPIYIVAPIIVAIIYLYVVNGLKKEYVKVTLTLVASMLIGYIFNKYLTQNLNFIHNFDREVIKYSYDISKNLQDIIFNFLWYCGSTNMNVYSLNRLFYFDHAADSLTIIFIFVRFIFAIFTISLPIILRKKINEFSLKEKIIYIYTTALTFIILFFLLIGNMVMWHRYIGPVVFFLSLLYILYYKYVIVNTRVKHIFIAILSIFCVYSLFVNVQTYYSIKDNSFKENYYEGVTNFLVENDLKYGFVYTVGEHNLYSLLSDGQVRVVRIETETLEPNYWLTSDQWYQNDYHNGEMFFMRKGNEMSLEIESEAIRELQYDTGEETFYIFVFENDDFFQYIISEYRKNE